MCVRVDNAAPSVSPLFAPYHRRRGIRSSSLGKHSVGQATRVPSSSCYCGDGLVEGEGLDLVEEAVGKNGRLDPLHDSLHLLL